MVSQYLTELMAQQDNVKIQEKYLKEKMAGHMGAKFRTTLGLEVVETDLKNNLLYLKGAVPGSKNRM